MSMRLDKRNWDLPWEDIPTWSYAWLLVSFDGTVSFSACRNWQTHSYDIEFIFGNTLILKTDEFDHCTFPLTQKFSSVDTNGLYKQERDHDD